MSTATKAKKVLKGGLDAGQGSLNGLAEAKKKLEGKKPPELSLPPSARPDMTGLQLLKLQRQEADAKDKEIAPRVAEWMENDCLPGLDDIEDQLKDMGKEILTYVVGLDAEGENITFDQQRDEYQKMKDLYLSASISIGQMADGKSLNYPCKATRNAAHMAVVKHRLRDQEMNRQRFLDTVNSLEKEGYFVPDEKGRIQVWTKRYSLCSSPDMGELNGDQEALVGEIIGHHTKRINDFSRADLQEEVEVLKKQSEISVQNLLDGKAGKCFTHVPKAVTQNFTAQDVYLLLEGNGQGRVVILDALGPDSKAALEIKRKKIHHLLFNLKIPFPPSVKTLMDKGFKEEDANLVRRFWYYMDRVRTAHEERQQREESRKAAELRSKEAAEARHRIAEEAKYLKDEYEEEADIALDRILLEITPMDGVFYAECSREWKNPDGSTIPAGHLYFLGEQKVIDGKAHLKVKRAPSHLVDGTFFAEQNMDFAPCGERFQGLTQPLQGLMKALFRQESHKLQS